MTLLQFPYISSLSNPKHTSKLSPWYGNTREHQSWRIYFRSCFIKYYLPQIKLIIINEIASGGIIIWVQFGQRALVHRLPGFMSYPVAENNGGRAETCKLFPECHCYAVSAIDHPSIYGTSLMSQLSLQPGFLDGPQAIKLQDRDFRLGSVHSPLTASPCCSIAQCRKPSLLPPPQA